MQTRHLLTDTLWPRKRCRKFKATTAAFYFYSQTASAPQKINRRQQKNKIKPRKCIPISVFSALRPNCNKSFNDSSSHLVHSVLGTWCIDFVCQFIRIVKGEQQSRAAGQQISQATECSAWLILRIQIKIFNSLLLASIRAHAQNWTGVVPVTTQKTTKNNYRHKLTYEKSNPECSTRTVG